MNIPGINIENHGILREFYFGWKNEEILMEFDWDSENYNKNYLFDFTLT